MSMWSYESHSGFLRGIHHTLEDVARLTLLHLLGEANPVKLILEEYEQMKLQ